MNYGGLRKATSLAGLLSTRARQTWLRQRTANEYRRGFAFGGQRRKKRGGSGRDVDCCGEGSEQN